MHRRSRASSSPRQVEIDGGDNTTAQVIRVRSVEQVGMYRGRPYRLPI